LRNDPLPLVGATPPYLLGRVLLALYFLVPGLSKVADFEGTAAYMAEHGVPLVVPLLAVTIVIQVGGAVALAIGWQTRWLALLFAGLVLAINLFMHDFWNSYESTDAGHELQNFIKNLAIMAGLLVLAGSASPGDRAAGGE
jgi:putative oxidoreductase